MYSRNSHKTLLALLLGAVIATGCGDGKPKEASKDATQVAARVNGTELTVHQVNFAMQRAQNVSPENARATSRRILNTLVDQELLVQQAEETKLDRDPVVVQALEAAKRSVLAEAYLARKLGAPAEPTDAEISEYFKAHPELFSARKIYQLQELAVHTKDEAQKAEVRAKLEGVKNLGEFAKWLTAQGVEFKGTQAVKAAEQLPLPILGKLSTMPKGQAMIVNVPDGLMVVILADEKEQPVSADKAKPVIAKLLAGQKRQAAIKAEVDALKAAAKIEYLGEFAGAGKEESPAAEAPKPAETGEHEGADASLNKGLSGL